VPIPWLFSVTLARDTVYKVCGAVQICPADSLDLHWLEGDRLGRLLRTHAMTQRATIKRRGKVEQILE
jgi:hypothetical protein